MLIRCTTLVVVAVRRHRIVASFVVVVKVVVVVRRRSSVSCSHSPFSRVGARTAIPSCVHTIFFAAFHVHTIYSPPPAKRFRTVADRVVRRRITSCDVVRRLATRHYQYTSPLFSIARPRKSLRGAHDSKRLAGWRADGRRACG